MSFLGKERWGVSGLGSSACKIPNRFPSESAFEFHLPRQTPYYYELRRQLEAAELALAVPALAADRPYSFSGYGGAPADRPYSFSGYGGAPVDQPYSFSGYGGAPADRPYFLSGYGGGPNRSVVKVPGSTPGKIPNPSSDLGKMKKSVVRYEADASDPTAVWRVVHLRPSEEPRKLPDRVPPAEWENEKTRRSGDLRWISLNSTQGTRLRNTSEGNFNSPPTGFSVVANGRGEDQLPHVFVASPTLNNLNPSHGPELARQCSQYPRKSAEIKDYQLENGIVVSKSEEVIDGLDCAVLGDFGIPSWLFGPSLPNPDFNQILGAPDYKAFTGDGHNVDRKLRQKLDMTEDEAHSQMKQGAFLYNLKAQTLPKIHHCYFIRLTLEYCKFSSLDSYEPSACKFNNPKHLGKMDGNETDQQGKYNYGWLAKEEDYTPGDSVGRFLSENGNHEEKDGGGVVFSGHSDGPNECISDLAHWLSLRFVTLRFQVFSTFCNGDFNQKRIQNILREYTESGDADEAFSCIRELGLPFFHLEVVTRALIFGMENILSTPLILKLLKESTAGCLISSNQMSKGFSQLAESVDDLSLDIPSAITLFDKLVSIAISEEWLDASFSKSAIPDGTIVGREDKKHSQVIRIWDPGSGSKSMNWGDPVMFNPEFVMCDTTLHRELLLTFLPVGFQIENLDWDSCEDDEMMGLHWEISDIICIDCKWTLSVGSALITLLEGSGVETINSGPVKVQFCVTNLQWPSRQQKNWRLASRYQEIWNKIPSDDFELENWSLIVTRYPGEVETFEDDVLFTGGKDGAIRLLSIYDISDDEDINSAVTWVPHVNPVHSLAFEYPWLASASSDGRISLIDLRKLLTPKGSSKHPFRVKSFGPSAIAPPQRVINLKNWNLTACRTAFHQGNDQQTYSETRGHDFVLNVSFDEIKVAEYDGLVIPGGCAPEFLAIDKRVFNSVRKFSGTKKPIASVYYGRLILAATAVGWNRTCTAYPAVKPVLVAAAARWEEANTMAKCLADGNLFTAAAYDAHPEFISLFVKALGGSVAGLNKRIWFLSGKYFLAGVVDGLNNRVDDLVAFVEKNKLVVSTYCSLMHTVVDLARETGMIHGYGFVGEMDKAVKLIDGMVLTGWKPNAFICSTLLDGYCKEVRTVDATTLFKEMLGKGINPGAITYIILLDGLFKTWRTAVAKEFLKSLKVVYKLQLPKGVGIHRVSHVSQLKIHCGPKVITSPDLSLVIKEDKLRVEPISVMEIIVLLRDWLVSQRLTQWEICHLLMLMGRCQLHQCYFSRTFTHKSLNLGFLISILEDKYVFKGEGMSESGDIFGLKVCCFFGELPLRQFKQIASTARMSSYSKKEHQWPRSIPAVLV